MLMNKDIKVLGIVPARKGSKRIPGKNIKEVAGKPLIVYTFEIAKKSKLLTRLIVSTDDEEVIRLANQSGIEVPFVRPAEFASDTATDFDWIKHAVEELADKGWKADYVVILRATNPLRIVEDIDLAVEKILETSADSVRLLNPIKEHPYWLKTVQGDWAMPFIELGIPEEQLRSQDLPKLYFINGVVDVIDVHNLKNNCIYGKKISYVMIDWERSLDIDDISDFNYAEFYFTKKKLQEENSCLSKN